MFTRYTKRGIIWLLFIFAVRGELDEEEMRSIRRRPCMDKSFCTERLKQYCKYDYYTTHCPQLCEKCDEQWVDPAHCKKIGCNQGCRWSLNGDDIHCVCMEDGYKLQADGKTCEDIDECVSNPCDDGLFCNNRYGSFDCTKEKICYSPTTKYYDSEDTCCKITENTCGQNRKTGLRHDMISPGQDPSLLDFPWTAMVVVDGDERCAGAILSDRWILAPAHCLHGSDVTQEIRVEIGSRAVNERNWIDGGTQEIIVDYWVIHPDFNFPYHDIALLHLSHPASTSGWVYPVCLPNMEIPHVGDKCWMNGFESYVRYSKIMMKLGHIDVTIADPRPCQERMQTYGIFDEQFVHICGEFTENRERSDCPGEIGGILVCQRATSCDWYIAGIASFGDTCSQVTSSSYVTFASVFDHQKWISTITNIPVALLNEQGDENVHKDWTTWTTWTACSQSCGAGQQRRTRTCVGCEEEETEERSCNTHKCSEWSEWTRWSPCTQTCGGGTSRRRRSCDDDDVGSCGDGPSVQLVRCNQHHCPTEWSPYGAWSSCSRTCGGGIRNRIRRCVNGIVGDTGCEGSRKETEACGTQSCESWSEWSGWSECSESCGFDSRRERKRFCRRGRVGDVGCTGSWREEENCRPGPCQQSWLPWGPWQPCSRSCDGGEQRSVRKCPLDGACEGEQERMQNCNSAPCNFLMSDWTDWTPCSVTCSEGIRERSRTCESPICPKSPISERSRCDLGPCVPQWTDWSSWSECPAQCGKKALVTRMRSCPEGSTCEGHSVDMKPCNGSKCPVDSCDHLDNSESINFCLNQIPNCGDVNRKTRSSCAKTCCYSQRITERGICEDHHQWKSSCQYFTKFCDKFPNMKLNCRRTCGFC